MKTLNLFGLGLLGLLLCSTAARGADWLSGCQNIAATRAAARAGIAVTSVPAGGSVCTFPTSTDPDPPVLDTTACENWDVLIYSDADGDGTACGACTYSVEHCPFPANKTAADDDDNELTETEAGNGCVAFSTGGTHSATGETLGGASDDQTGTASNDPVVRVRCNGTRQ
jgi:hypothetical protein